MEDFSLIHRVAVTPLEAAEDDRRDDGKSSENKERLMNPVDHREGIGIGCTRNEKRRG